MNTCVTCKFCNVQKHPQNARIMIPFCLHPERQINPVTGNQMDYTCEVMREMIDVPHAVRQGICGFDGNWWQERSHLVLMPTQEN